MGQNYLTLGGITADMLSGEMGKPYKVGCGTIAQGDAKFL